MRFLSLFSGIEAASMAWTPLGWEPAAFSEIEPFPCSVLQHHYPHVPNLGDVTKITRQQVEALGRIDLVCGGFPCQDLSIAGKRKGLMNADGNPTRSGLFFDAMRIAEWARARWTVLENVPGLFSSNGGRDFAAVVGEMAGCEFDVPTNGWENAGVAVGPLGLIEWITLDAQYVRVESHPRAVPQRRRRVFLVRDSGNWANRPPLFLERESLCGHPAPRRQAGQVVAGTLSARTKGGGGHGTDFELGGGLVSHALRGEGFDASEDGTGRGTPLVPVAFSCKDYGADAGEVAPTLRSMGHDKSHANAGGQVAIALNARQDPDHWHDRTGPLDTDGGTQAVSYAIQAGALRTNPASGPDGVGVQADHAYTLEARAEAQVVALAVALRGREGGATAELGDEVQNCLRASSGGGDKPHVLTAMQVRRLTPTEAERLMGFPDGYTAIPWRGKPASECPDGPRYKSLGNSWAVPVAAWVGKRIQELENGRK